MEPIYVHVIDPDRDRGREIARHLSARAFFVEAHEGVSGLLSHPRRGVALMSDDHGGPAPAKALEAIEGCNGYLPAALFSSSVQPRRVFSAMAAGIIDYFEWPCSPTRLGEIVIRLTVQGERRATIEALRTHARELVQRLSERERELLRCLMRGTSAKQLASALGIGPAAAEIHRAQMMSRLGARASSDAVRIGIHAGLDEVKEEKTEMRASRAALVEEASLAR